MKRLLGNSILLFAGQFLAQALGAILFWLIARTSEPSDFGAVMATLGIAMLIATVLDFGVNTYSIRMLAADPNASNEFVTTFSIKFYLGLAVSAIWCVAAIVWVSQLHGTVATPIFALYIFFFMLSTTLLVPFRSQERMAVVAVAQTLQSAVALVVALVAISTDVTGSSVGLSLGLSMGAIAATAFAWYRLGDAAPRLRRVSLHEFADLWRSSYAFGVTALATQAQRADVAIVGTLAGSQAAGIFAAPARLTNLLGMLPLAYTAAVFPHASKVSDRTKRQRDWLIGTALLLLAMVIQFAIIFVFADRLVESLLGSNYASSGQVLRIYLIGMLFASANSPFAALVQAEGGERFVARAVLGATAFGLVTVGLGAALAGARGAAAGFVFQQLLISLALSTHIFTRWNSVSPRLGTARIEATNANP